VNELVILVPVLARPQRVKPVLDAFMRTVPGARVCFIPNEDDQPEIAAIEAAGGEILCKLNGNYAVKINTAVELTGEPLIFLGADDLLPLPGWFEAAAAYLHGSVQVVGMNDLIRRSREHTTHFLMTRGYAERPTISGERGPLCERYDHSCVDDELIGTARHRFAYAYAVDARVQHLHPDNRTADMDETYRKGRAMLREDRRLWRHRQYWHLR
jgi:hypothetical protein